MSDQPTYIDLFAGCGGLSLGLSEAGWKGIFAVEKSDMAFETLKHNLRSHFDWPAWLPVTNHTIGSILKSHKKDLARLRGKVDLVAGGPPCQGFSMAGRRERSDRRNRLVSDYVRFVEIVRPKLIFFENVRGFTIGFKTEKSVRVYAHEVQEKLRRLGYDVEGKLVKFSDYGIPQRRERFIIVGVLNGRAKDFFDELLAQRNGFLSAKGLDPSKGVSLKEALSDLETRHGTQDCKEFKGFKEGVYGSVTSAYQQLMREGAEMSPDSNRLANHGEKTVERFRTILRVAEKDVKISDELRKQFKLKKHTVVPLDGSRCAPTLTTLPDDFIHYSEPRILTVREYARIQSFPDKFQFKSKYTTGGERRKIEVPRYTQVGNAIPPLFAELSGVILNSMRIKMQKHPVLVDQVV